MGGGWIATSTYAYANQGYTGSWGGATVATDPRGTPVWVYNDAGLRTTQTEVYAPGAGGSLTLLERRQRTYDTNTNVLTTTDPNGRVVTTTYDTANADVKARGNRLTTTWIRVPVDWRC